MSIDLREVDRIVNEARASLGHFCLEECKGYCCRKGYLALDNSNVDLVSQGHKEEYLKTRLLKLMSPGKYSISIVHDCPCLDHETILCRIYADKRRPKVCAEFPVLMHESTIIFSSRCLAVRENKLFGYMKELEMLGCRIIESDSFVDFIVNVPEDSFSRQ